LARRRRHQQQTGISEVAREADITRTSRKRPDIGIICFGRNRSGQSVAPAGKRTVNSEPLPSSLVRVTSPPITRELAGHGEAEPSSAITLRGHRVGPGEFLEQLGLLLVSQFIGLYAAKS
jgi:hypothetical protein